MTCIRSEEVFDYSSEEMTQDKIREMKASLNREIGQIFELCFFVVVRTAVGVRFACILFPACVLIPNSLSVSFALGNARNIRPVSLC